MESRGFIENSFITGQTPQEFFFQAMTGRVGLIDTAVKTADTGYIQRKLIKAMEDLHVGYDYSVRSASGGIIQNVYGNDGMNASYVEAQQIPLFSGRRIYTLKEINDNYTHPTINGWQKSLKSETWSELKAEANYKKIMKEYIDKIVEYRRFIAEDLYSMYEISGNILFPVPFSRIINNIRSKKEYVDKYNLNKKKNKLKIMINYKKNRIHM